MTLTELRYIIAVARERHFGRAAEACFVSQPSLSVAVKKLEEELGVSIFERRSTEIALTPIGKEIINQAHKVIEESKKITEIANQGEDSLNGPLRLGSIFTIAPYLLPGLVIETTKIAPKMPIYIEENYTNVLLDKLRSGTIDVAIVANTFIDPTLEMSTLYQEDFVLALPFHHPWANRSSIGIDELSDQTMLLLGKGHCFRDQILDFCPDSLRFSSNASHTQKMVEGSSLQTILYMVYQGLGITILPASSVSTLVNATQIKILPFKKPAPSREVVLVWRKSYTRPSIGNVIREAFSKIKLNGCYKID